MKPRPELSSLVLCCLLLLATSAATKAMRRQQQPLRLDHDTADHKIADCDGPSVVAVA
jgi:hypothetical protein